MKILIPIDGSDCSARTIEWAAETLNPQATECYLVHVINVVTDTFMVETEIQDSQRMLNAARKILEDKGFTVAKTEYVMGDPAREICECARDLNVDQVLMGSHGRSGLKKMLLGSVSENVLEHCEKPVFIYRNVAARKAPATTG